MKKQICISLLVSLIILLGCNRSGRKEFRLSKPDKMALILADIHIAESTLSKNSSAFSSESHKGGYKQVLEKYGLDKAGFDSSVSYYSSKPDVYQKIYEDVLVILSEKEMSVRALKDDTIAVAPKSAKKMAASKQSLWEGGRSLKINSQDSTRLTADFEFSTDSLFGGEVILRAKYKFSTKEPLRVKHKMNLFATYADGSRDSSETIVSNTRVYRDFTSTLVLKQLGVIAVSGNFVTYSKYDPLIVDIIDIQLDWNPLVSPEKKSIK